MRRSRFTFTARRPESRRVRPPLEALECRRLLAGDPGTIVLDPASSGSVNVTGTDAADVIRAERVGTDDVRFTLNSQSKTFDLDDFGTISLDGLGGNDSITAVGDLSRVVLILDGGAGSADTLSSNSPMTFMWNGEVLRDNARTVAARQADGSLRITGTAGNDTIRLTNTTEGQDLRVNASFHGVVVTSEYTGFFAAGGGGDDRFVVGDAFSGSVANAVTLGGEAGNDTFEVARGANVDVLGGADNDLLRALGGNPDDEGLPNISSFQGGTGTDTIELSGQGSLDLNDYPDVENVTNARGTVTGNALFNRIVADPNDTAGVVFRGGAGNDTLIGAGGPDQLFGEANDDTLIGNGGNDLLDGGDGTDSADGGPGDDTVRNAEAGPDTVTRPPNTIVAEQSRVQVTGTEGNDVIVVERVGTDDVRITLNSTVRTFDMDDVGGDYSLWGLGGNDSITVRGDIRFVTLSLNGGEGTDTLTANNAYFSNGEFVRDPAGRLVVERDPVEGYIIRGTAANDTIQLADLGDGPLVRVNTFSGIFPDFTQQSGRYVFAGAGNDRISIDGLFPGTTQSFGEDGNDTFEIGTNTTNFVYGGNGDDTLIAAGENFDQVSLFEAGGGVDTIQFDGQSGLAPDDFDAHDWENATNARGTVFGNTANNRIVADPTDTAGVRFFGRAGNDTLIGGAGPDELFGEDDNDTLIGNAGNDTLNGGPGVDSLDGGPGDDTLLNGETDTDPSFVIISGTLTVNGTAANETLSVVRTGTDDVRVSVNAVTRTFDMDDFDRIEISGGAGNDTMTIGAGVANVTLLGEQGDDRLTGNDLRNSLIGDEGADTLVGNGGDDFLGGAAGNDSLNGGSGNDQLFGGDGDDTITGGTGDDFMRGDDGTAGADTFFARDGQRDQLVDGDAGHDRAQVDDNDVLEEIEELLP